MALEQSNLLARRVSQHAGMDITSSNLELLRSIVRDTSKYWLVSLLARSCKLVGYDSTNIYKVYVPSLDKVIRVRDVMFNEDQFTTISTPT